MIAMVSKRISMCAARAEVVVQEGRSKGLAVAQAPGHVNACTRYVDEIW